MAGCGGGSPCDHVLNSRWSMVVGVLPVSGLAAGVYLAMLVAGLFIGPATEKPIQRMAWSAMLVLGGSVAGSAVWFIILQKWFVGEFCLYCMSAHITGLLLAVLVIWRAMIEPDDYSNNASPTESAVAQNLSSATPPRTNGPVRKTGMILIGLVLAGILATFQVGFTPSAVPVVGESEKKVPPIDYRTVPMVGSPDAPYVVNLLFDYECPHCEQIYLMLDEAIHRYGGKLAIALCPTPLNSHCNPYIPQNVDEFKNSCELARIGLAVWLARREAFSEFNNWMFTYESGDRWNPRSIEAAKAKAAQMIGQAKFDSASTDPWIEQYLETSIRMYGQTLQNGNGGVPKMIFGSHWVIPEPRDANDLVVILRKSLGVPKP